MTVDKQVLIEAEQRVVERRPVHADLHTGHVVEVAQVAAVELDAPLEAACGALLLDTQGDGLRLLVPAGRGRGPVVTDDRGHRRRANGEGTISKRSDGRWAGAAYVYTTSGAVKRKWVYG